MTQTITNPFVGLRPFESDEDYLFFGRENQTLELLQRLHRFHFVAVIGSSGSGKSSLVKAGLIPALEAGYLVNDLARWIIATVKPGLDPLYNLVAGILEQVKNENSATASDIVSQIKEEGVDALLDIIKPLLQDKANFFLLVDQFEELFRFSIDQKELKNKDEATDFVNILLALASQLEIPVYVVITMRSDFIGDCTQFSGLPEALNQSQYLVPRLKRTQLETAIQGPVGLYNVKISPGLTARLLNDAQIVKDELPLLEHALMRTWDHEIHVSKNGELDIDDYEMIGGIEKALSNHADEALVGMSDEELLLTKNIFQALTTVDDNGRKVRRPIRLGELEAITGTGSEKLLSLIKRFIEGNRSFLVINKSGKEKDWLIDISHESLIRQWTTLNAWVDEEAESGRTYIRLTESVNLFEEKKKDLLTGSELLRTLEWFQSFKPGPEWAKQYEGNYDKNISYLKQSIKAAKWKKNKGRLLRGAVMLAMTVLVIVLLIAYQQAVTARTVATVQRVEAEKQKGIAIVKTNETKLALDSLELQKARADANARIALAEKDKADINLALAISEKKNANLNEAKAKSAQRIAESQYEAFRLNALAQEFEAKDPTVALRLEEAALKKDSNAIILSSAKRLYAKNCFYKTLYKDTTDLVEIQASSDNTNVLTISQNVPPASMDDFGYSASMIKPDGTASTLLKFNGYRPIFSLDGTKILVPFRNSSVEEWDINGRKLTSFNQRMISVMTVSNNGANILTASDDSAFLRNSEGRILKTFKDSSYIEFVAFSPDNKNILIGSAYRLTLWDPANNKTVRLIPAYAIAKATFSPDGSKILVFSAPRTRSRSDPFFDKVQLWDVENKTLMPLSHPGKITCAVFSPNSKNILTGGSNNKARLWNIGDTSFIAELSGHITPISALAFSPDDHILTGSDDGAVKLWNMDGNELNNLRGHTGKVTYLAFSPDGTLYYSGSADGTIRAWNAPLKEFNGHEDAINLVVFSPDNKSILTGSSDNTARLWSLNGETKHTYEYNDEVSSVAFSRDSKKILLASGDTAYLRNIKDTVVKKLVGHDSTVQSVTFSPDDKKVLTASDDGTVRLWNINDDKDSGQVVAKHSDGVVAVCFSRDGTQFLTASRDSTARLWDLKGIKDRKNLTSRKTFRSLATVFTVAFSPDNNYILTGSEDSTARLWNINGDLLKTFHHLNVVESVAFSPDGLRILTSSRDHTAKLWKRDGTLLMTVDVPDIVRTVAFSPDGKYIFIGAGDNIGRLYRAMTFEDFINTTEADILTKKQKQDFNL